MCYMAHSFRYVTNQPPKANSAFYPSGVGKCVPASTGKAKAGMVHSVSGWTRGVQVKLWDPLRTRAIPERLRGVFMMRRYTNPRLPYLISPYENWPKIGNKTANTNVKKLQFIQMLTATLWVTHRQQQEIKTVRWGSILGHRQACYHQTTGYRYGYSMV